MTTKSSEERVKPFRLVKYFTFTSLILIFLGTLVLSALNTHLARTMQLKKSEEYALLLAENLSHQIFVRFVIPVALKYGKIQLRKEEQFELMDRVVRSALHGFGADMVNIYDMNNTISYSFNQELIGKKDIGGTGYENAVLGKSTSKLVQDGSAWEIILGLPTESRLTTFAPLYAEKPLSRMSEGPILGVVEIVQDMSDEYEAIFEFQILVVITCAVVMGIFFLSLFFVVKRGEGIIQRRALERLRLEEQLNRIERLSLLGDMAARISHEIRNPLGIIKSSVEHLKKKKSGLDPPNSVLDIIIEETDRLNGIITDFLNFAKPINPNLSLFRIDEILEKNLKFLAPQMEKQSYTVKKHYANNLQEVMADSAMLYQVFLNILINAMQAMPDGGRIYVKVSSDSSRVTILIEDEGEGIPEDALEKIWVPFFTTKERGTGLGLGIVKNIIESHEGSIRIDNRPAGGARVTIELPVYAGCDKLAES